jgi:hypothetical protein
LLHTHEKMIRNCVLKWRIKTTASYNILYSTS